MFRFIAIGSFFALTSEVLFKFVATFNPKGFVIALVFWPLYVTFAFGVSKLLAAVFRRQLQVEILSYLGSGLLGLYIEWTVLGNSPSSNPNASQLTMFSIWASAMMAPRVLGSRLEGMDSLKKQLRGWFGLYVGLSLVAIFFPHPLKALWIFILAMPGYIVLNVFYFRYFAAIRRAA